MKQKDIHELFNVQINSCLIQHIYLLQRFILVAIGFIGNYLFWLTNKTYYMSTFTRSKNSVSKYILN